MNGVFIQYQLAQSEQDVSVKLASKLKFVGMKLSAPKRFKTLWNARLSVPYLFIVPIMVVLFMAAKSCINSYPLFHQSQRSKKCVMLAGRFLNIYLPEREGEGVHLRKRPTCILMMILVLLSVPETLSRALDFPRVQILFRPYCQLSKAVTASKRPIVSPPSANNHPILSSTVMIFLITINC